MKILHCKIRGIYPLLCVAIFFLLVFKVDSFGQQKDSEDAPPLSATAMVWRFYDGSILPEGGHFPKIKKRDMRVEVGDSTKAVKEGVSLFDPSINFDLWQGECKFNISLKNRQTRFLTSAVPKITQRLDGYKSVLVSDSGDVPAGLMSPPSNIDYKIYQRSDGLEWEIILYQKPTTNKFIFNIQTKNLNFYYQPPLTAQEIAMGAERPDSVVGSYAVYHAYKRDNIRHINGEDTTYENYGTGKAFHIFRPKAIDANGNKVWGTLFIDTSNAEMIIVVPESFLDTAVYPVSIDPTFGNTIVGASNVGLTAGESYGNAILVNEHTAGSSETVDSIYIYGKSYNTDDSFNLALYTTSGTDSLPVTRTGAVDTIGVTEGSTPQWYVAYAGVAMTSGTKYTLAVGNNYNLPRIYYDSYSGGASRETISGIPPISWTHLSYMDYQLSLYAIYTSGNPPSSNLYPRRKKIILLNNGGQ